MSPDRMPSVVLLPGLIFSVFVVVVASNTLVHEMVLVAWKSVYNRARPFMFIKSLVEI